MPSAGLLLSISFANTKRIRSLFHPNWAVWISLKMIASRQPRLMDTECQQLRRVYSMRNGIFTYQFICLIAGAILLAGND